MLKNILLFFISIFFIAACNNEPAPQEPAGKTTIAPPVYKMDLLEKMFTNDNWMKVDGRDTSYYYFSRIPSETRVHQYRMSKGDSVNTTISVIRFLSDSLVWQYNDTTHLFLSGITEKRAEWSRMDHDPPAFYMAFAKKDEKNINLVFPDKKQVLLIKTLPLSTFLVRSRYDFSHGTKFAFSDTVFSAGKKK